MSAGGFLNDLGIAREPSLEPTFDLRRSHPLEWPATATAWGSLDGRPLVVHGSYGGAVWVHDLATGALSAGPFADVAETVTVSRHPNAATPSVDAVGLTETAAGPVVAAAMEGRTRVWRLDGSEITAFADEAGWVVALAAGRLGGAAALVTGSRGGLVVVWELDTMESLCRITLDAPIVGTWIVNAATIVGVLDDRGQLRLFDLAASTR